MPHPRLTPFDLVFGPTADTAFPPIRSALARSSRDPRERDGFFLEREAIALLRDIRPDEGLGEGIEQLAALVHHAYLFWDAGSLTVEVSGQRAAELLGPDRQVDDAPAQVPAYYTQFPERRIWAHVVPGQPPEPLDGCFVHPDLEPATLRVLGVFGLHPERQGFSVVEVVGRRPRSSSRADGSPPFTATLTGGAAARLFSLEGEEELLELGWRTRALLAASSVEPSRWRA